MKIENINAFGFTLEVYWQNFSSIPDINVLLSRVELEPKLLAFCEHDKFYLKIDGVARYLVLPERNICFIEKASQNVSDNVVATWLMGTVFAYVLQYHGYLVLHGSAVEINQRAVIFSGESGAGKSTLAAAMMGRGYAVLTDDVCVITRNSLGKLILVPGPARLKLWDDALFELNYDKAGLNQVVNKVNKYELTLNNGTSDVNSLGVEISNFYELNPISDITNIKCTTLTGVSKLHTLVSNTYRYGMLKPLNKIKNNLTDCGALAEQISVAKIIRPMNRSLKYSLTELMTVIDQDLNSVVTDH